MNALSIKTLMLTLVASIVLMLGMTAFQTVNAAPADEACAALAALGEACTPDGAASQNKLVAIAIDIIDILSWAVGIISVIMVIIGGFRYMTSAGDPGNVSGAKNTIIYALVGMAIVIFAQAIVAFVLSKIK